MTRKEIVLKAISEVVSGCDPKRFAESNQTLYKVALKVAELCTKSFFPSNLDEAAEQYERGIGSQDYYYLDIEDAFKAGAEWMARICKKELPA